MFSLIAAVPEIFLFLAILALSLIGLIVVIFYHSFFTFLMEGSLLMIVGASLFSWLRKNKNHPGAPNILRSDTNRKLFLMISLAFALSGFYSVWLANKLLAYAIAAIVTALKIATMNRYSEKTLIRQIVSGYRETIATAPDISHSEQLSLTARAFLIMWQTRTEPAKLLEGVKLETINDLVDFLLPIMGIHRMQIDPSSMDSAVQYIKQKTKREELINHYLKK